MKMRRKRTKTATHGCSWRALSSTRRRKEQSSRVTDGSGHSKRASPPRPPLVVATPSSSASADIMDLGLHVNRALANGGYSVQYNRALGEVTAPRARSPCWKSTEFFSAHVLVSLERLLNGPSFSFKSHSNSLYYDLGSSNGKQRFKPFFGCAGA